MAHTSFGCLFEKSAKELLKLTSALVRLQLRLLTVLTVGGRDLALTKVDNITSPENLLVYRISSKTYQDIKTTDCY
ncbi:hypothetical protein OJAV_G00235360 [Oryzias javanicus]|uniref:Uncharacterized protein n=1 Tax=Oryzias javanicus TaxID=123683 RepID=A0A437BYU1_ORYJA|nr:hypothetical protein OJAV_G00235360 [Oryzias javanicus]